MKHLKNYCCLIDSIDLNANQIFRLSIQQQKKKSQHFCFYLNQVILPTDRLFKYLYVADKLTVEYKEKLK